MQDNTPNKRTSIINYAKQKLFDEADENELFISDNPFRRPTRAKDLSFTNLENPVAVTKLATNKSLTIHRMLLNIYEAELLFLPAKEQAWTHFDEFYSYENQLLGEMARPHLEYLAFAKLEEEIDVTGTWSAALLRQYLKDFLTAEKAADNNLEADPISVAILRAPDPQGAAKHYLVQMAVDFLTEASAMARFAPGAYGPLQSALFNILIDEYGAAVSDAKHSKLFANTLSSVGLSTEIHYYWQFYQPSALALTNYFHYVTKNKRLFFRYLGALFYTEASLVNVTRRQSQLFRRLFGGKADTAYFDEHTHIDRYHGQMVLERLIEPAAEQYGLRAITEIVRGFEEFRLLQQLADRDLIAQLEWATQLKINDPRALAIKETWSSSSQPDLESFTEVRGERSTTHIHPDDRLLMLETGDMDFFPMAEVVVKLKAGDIAFVPKGRLHGSIVRSDDCLYHQPIVEAQVQAMSRSEAA